MTDRPETLCGYACVIGADDAELAALQAGIPRAAEGLNVHRMGHAVLAYTDVADNPLHRIALRQNGAFLLFVQGDFYEQFDHESVPDCLTGNEVSISRLKNWLSGLNGIFSGFILDSRSGEYWAFTDRFGFSYQYIGKEGGVTVIASSLWPFLNDSRFKHAYNNTAMKDILIFGYPLSDATPLKNVQLNQAAGIKCGEGASEKESKYVDWNKPRAGSLHESIQDVEDAFSSHLKSLSGLGVEDRQGLSLSGGHDSRVILTAMLREGLEPGCVVGHSGNISADSKRARAIAEALGLGLRFVDYSRSEEQDAWDTNVLVDGSGSGLWAMNLMRASADQGYPILSFGTSGDLLSGGWHVNPASYSSRVDLARAVLEQMYEYETPYEELVSVLYPDTTGSFMERFTATFNDDYSDNRNSYIAQRISSRNARRIRMFMQGAYMYGVPVHPFHDTRIAEAYLKIPYSYIKGQRAHVRLSYSGVPRLASIAASNSRLPVILEPWLQPLLKRCVPDRLRRLARHSFRHSGRPHPANIQIENGLKDALSMLSIDSDRYTDIIANDRRGGLLLARLRYITNIINPEHVFEQSSYFRHMTINGVSGHG